MSLLPDMVERLAIGTVQFGLEYGIANQQGKVTYEEAKSILKLAKNNKINMLDTAISYGNSEEVLGGIGVSYWNVISKLPAIPDDCDNVNLWLNNIVTTSLKRLNVASLYGLLLHRPQQLLGANGDDLYQGLQRLKSSGKVKKIGVSIYEPSELDAICGQYEIDIVQAPLNIVDHRIVESGWLSSLSEQGIELHVRSVFLQGLLLMSASERPQKFNKWASLWSNWDEWLSENNLTPLQACLQYVLSFSDIKKVIVGVDSLQQLDDIICACNGSLPEVPKNIHCSDVDLVNPARWSSL